MSQKIRILQYVRVLDNGGTENLVFSLLDKIDREAVAFDFLLTRNQKEAFDSEIEKYQCRKVIVELPHRKTIAGKAVVIYKQMYSYFTHCDYSIVHFQSVGTSVLGSLPILAAKRAGIPVRIIHAHASNSPMPLLRRINVLGGQITHRLWGTHFMACSESAAEFSFGKKYREKITVKILKNGIDVEKYRFNENARIELRRELNLENSFVIGSIGRLSPEKNHLFMLDILEAILEEKPDARLVIIGSESASHEEYAAQLKKSIHMRGLEKHVLSLGERKDAWRFYSAFDVFLFPSLREGFGIAAIEAQANGLPVFASASIPKATNLTSCIRYIDLDEAPKTWAEQIMKSSVRKDEAYKISEAGFDIRFSAADLQTFYEDLASTN